MIATLNANAYHIPLANETAQCCITSPPYFGLRSYLDANDPLKHLEIGSESTPELYIEHLVAVFREVKRVLRSDGVALLNLGNCYQDKQLQCIPHRVAFALQADGWYLRSAIPWIKKNCMPESVTDRPTTAHEYWFLLAKSRKYYWDADAIKRDALTSEWPGIGPARIEARGRGEKYKPMTTRAGRNYRTSDIFFESLDVIVDEQRRYLAHLEHIRDEGGLLLDEGGDPLALVVNTQAYGRGHFAAFPEKLVEPLILASTSACGMCPRCRTPWVRSNRERTRAPKTHPGPCTGWQPQCNCNAGEPVPCLVLDPFSGTSVVGRVCIQHHRSFVGLELNHAYIALARDRTSNVQIRLEI